MDTQTAARVVSAGDKHHYWPLAVVVGQAIILLSLGGWKYPFGGPGWVLPGGGSLGSHLFGVRASNSFLGGVRMVQASCLQAEKIVQSKSVQRGGRGLYYASLYL